MSSGHAPVTRLLALRHGESEWNAVGRWQGQEDPPLTETGLLQAVAAAEQLGTFDAVWASTLQRAAHTAAVVAESIGVGPVQTHPGLMEAAFGPWQGLTVSEIEAGWPGYLEAHRRPDGAEAPEQVTERALQAFRDIAATTPGGEVLVVSHAGLIRTVCRAVGGLDVRFPNLGGVWFLVHGDGTVHVGEQVQLVEPTAFRNTL
ncbi:MAG: histidine phosphatase family protein [Ilumatobacteraceae bacterium]